ncbi:hypothetical protein [Afipia felis]|uniref:Uncharacterized protein n=2 Tax=Afipia felis TaxID=1035 RepID=A0A380WB76_AFIFE|nr:hypothetical protein [Afipia felis]EKS29389.1 hypothetical protein HMPREF9697_01917 [Afipia felis ATCC 53690]SUU78097.1 Uncharacterised protein [Afipia felis]SUU86162.1 Uncharacterised protein [Afipia felis]
MKMAFTHPSQIDAIRRKDKRERENHANLKRIAAGTSAPEVSSRIAPYGLNRPHEVVDFPYLAHNGPEDKSPKEKCISLVTGDRVPAKFEQDYIAYREYAEACIAEKYEPFGATPIHFDLYAIELGKDGKHAWRGRGAFDPSFVWDMERFPDRLGRIGATLAARGLYIVLDVVRDCNLICDASGKVISFRGAASDYDLTEKQPRVRLVADGAIRIRWEQKSFGKWITKAIVAHNGEALPPGKGKRYAERVERYSKLKDLDYRPHTFAVYDINCSDKGGTQFYAIGKDNLWHQYGRCKGNAFTGDEKADGFDLDGFGDLPGSLTAEQLAFLDCRLAAQGFEIALVPTEDEDFNEEATTQAELLSLMSGCNVSIPEGIDFG